MAEATREEVAENSSRQSNILCKFNKLNEKYENLRRLSARVVIEYEDLQLKCQESFQKFKDESSKYQQAKDDLEKLKQVSSLALEEYENLHRKYEVEQDCRNNAEQYATKVVKQNKELKRKSQMIIAQFGNLQTFQFPDDLLNGEPDDHLNDQNDDQSLTKEVLQSQINELKISLEDKKKELKDTRDKLAVKDEELAVEKQKSEMLNRKLVTNERQYRELNRVSVLALEEYKTLQQQYELETQCRSEAEKFAAEILKEKKIMATKSDNVDDASTTDTKLLKALKEIEELTINLEQEKVLVKELNEQLENARGDNHAKVCEKTLAVTQAEVVQLENRLNEANRRAEEAETKVSELEKKLKNGEGAATAQRTSQSEPLAAPPPPPPPPPPNQLIKKFMKIVGTSKKSSVKKSAAQAKDPRVEAMKEMMDRIKSGKVQLRSTRASTESDEQEAAPGISELGSMLRSMNNENVGPSSAPGVNESACAWSNVKLKKTQPSRTASHTGEGTQSGELEKVTLRKPRSRSTGDLLGSSSTDSATAELKKILEKKRAAAEPGLPSLEERQLSPSKDKDVNETFDFSDKETSVRESGNEETGSLQDQSDTAVEVEEPPNKDKLPSEPLYSAPDSPTDRTADA